MRENNRTIFTSNRVVKLCLSVSFLSIAGGIVSTHLHDSLFPFLYICIGSGVLGVFLLHQLYERVNRRDTTLLYGITFVSILLSTAYRLITFGFPSGLVGKDPDRYAIYSHLTIITGDSSIPFLKFYSNAPVFHIFTSQISLLGGLDPTESLAVFSVLSGIITPLIAVLFVQEILESPYGEVAGLLTVVAPLATRRAYWPIPQTLVAFMFLILLYLVLKSEYKSKRNLILVSLLYTAMIFTHKLTPIVLTSIVSVLLVLYSISGVLPIRGNGVSADFDYDTRLFLIIFCLLLIQWTVLTDYLSKSVRLIGVLLSLGGGSGLNAVTSVQPAYGTTPDPGWFGILSSHSPSLFLLGASGICWVYVLWTRSTRQEGDLLVFSSILAGLGVVTGLKSNIPASVQFTRLLQLGEVVFICLVVTAYRQVSQQSTVIKRVFTVILCLLLLSQAFSVAVIPDGPTEQRMYLTQGEATAKQFGHTYATGSIHTDSYYSHKMVNIDRIRQKSHPAVLPSWARSDPTTFQSHKDQHFTGTVFERNHSYVFHRTTEDIYEVSNKTRWERLESLSLILPIVCTPIRLQEELLDDSAVGFYNNDANIGSLVSQLNYVSDQLGERFKTYQDEAREFAESNQLKTKITKVRSLTENAGK